MKTIYHFAGLMVLALLCAGCYPFRVTSSPGPCGTVVDAQTRQPIAGASAQMSYTWRAYWSDLNPPTLDQVITNTRPPLVLTDTNGTFHIPRERMALITFPFHSWNSYGTLIVWKDGYVPAVFPISDVTNQDIEGGTFLLKPVQK
jgi:hypothetical protein